MLCCFFSNMLCRWLEILMTVFAPQKSKWNLSSMREFCAMFCMFGEAKRIQKCSFYLHWFWHLSYCVATNSWFYATGRGSELQIPQQKGGGLASPVTFAWEKKKKKKVLELTFRLDIRKMFFTETVVGHLNRLHKEVVTAPTLSRVWDGPGQHS